MPFEIPPDLDPSVLPIAFLLGHWHGNGHGDYPTIEQFAFRQEVALPGTPDPDVTVSPNVVGTAVDLYFEGHESPDCGGFAELRVYGG